MKLKHLILLTWLVGFYRQYETGLWYWSADHVGWGWDHPTVRIEPKFKSREECLEDWKNWIESCDDSEWKLKRR